MSERSDSNTFLSYQDAGVDIEAGDELVDRIKPAVASSLRPGVLGGLGGFGALFELPLERYRQPVLVSGADGVGTKLLLARQLNRHDTIGIDLVAMCANDILVHGAEPLFFLDYYASARLKVNVAAEVVAGIADGCRQAGAALVGGETAEMPGLYAPGNYDLAGFCVGVVEKEHILDGASVKIGDVIIGLASSGAHSNGYSLIRKILADYDTPLAQPYGDITLGEALLSPTRIYVKALLPLLDRKLIHALAHITGGGLTANIPRVLPAGCKAVIDTHTWPRSDLFAWLQAQGGIEEQEMLRTFNCGIGMVAITAASNGETIIKHCQQHGIDVWTIGTVIAASGEPQVVYKQGDLEQSIASS
ncbi:MAG TPA: phosphoribosylformylglycinamidine cyclo-ligase [Gammaproteobacteria bacterium]|nr:phosphoribosylformylglycinamidine cyclo-ligase [Gammaproteobacteria bacterium]